MKKNSIISICALCDQTTYKQADSHIIPRWMFEWLREQLPQNGSAMKIISSYPNEHEKRSQIGIYDNFVCMECEKKFGLWDDYAATILRKQPTSEYQGVNFGGYDYQKLKLFFLSVLWRAHASNHNFFDNINIGVLENRLGQCLLYKNLGGDDMFKVMVTYSNHPFSYGILAPQGPIPLQTGEYWLIYLPRFQAFFLENFHQVPEEWGPYILKPDQPLRMIEKSFTKDEIAYAYNAVLVNKKRK